MLNGANMLRYSVSKNGPSVFWRWVLSVHGLYGSGGMNLSLFQTDPVEGLFGREFGSYRGLKSQVVVAFSHTPEDNNKYSMQMSLFLLWCAQIQITILATVVER